MTLYNNILKFLSEYFINREVKVKGKKVTRRERTLAEFSNPSCFKHTFPEIGFFFSYLEKWWLLQWVASCLRSERLLQPGLPLQPLGLLTHQDISAWMPAGSLIGVKITFPILPNVSFTSKIVSSLPTLKQSSIREIRHLWAVGYHTEDKSMADQETNTRRLTLGESFQSSMLTPYTQCIGTRLAQRTLLPGSQGEDRKVESKELYWNQALVPSALTSGLFLWHWIMLESGLKTQIRLERGFCG